MARINIELNRKIDVLRQKVLDFVLLNNVAYDYEKLIYSIQEIDLNPDNEFERGYLKCLADILTAKDIFDADTKIFSDISKRQNSAELVSLLAKNNSLGHQELADKLELLPSGLSNLLKSLSETRIIDEWKVGRNKTYSLTKKGFLFLEWHELNNKKLKKSDALLYEWLNDKFTPSAFKIKEDPTLNFSKIEPSRSLRAATNAIFRLAESTKSLIIDIDGQNSTIFKDRDKVLLSMALGEEI